jgi:hypothetical protein
MDQTPTSARDLVAFLCKSEADVCIEVAVQAMNRCAPDVGDHDSARAALMDLPIDGHTFESTYGRARPAQIEALRTTYTNATRGRFPVDDTVAGFLGLLVATLCGLEISEVQRSHRLNSEITEKQAKSVQAHTAAVKQLFGDDRVRTQLIDIYFPVKDPWWTKTFEPESLELYCSGTTSVIISITQHNPNSLDISKPKQYAVKIVWLPFLRIAEIAGATENYARVYKLAGGPDVDRGGLVRIHDSGRGWVIMDLIEGITLDQFLAAPGEAAGEEARASLGGRLLSRLAKAGNPAAEVVADGIDLVTMEIVARGLCKALTDNQLAVRDSEGKRPDYHGDLSPANVILRDGRPGDFVLIDFGPNHLFTRTATVGDEAKADFIAPEVRKSRPVTKSDLFSVGQILIAAGRQRVDGRGIVPDRFYDSFPNIAEMLEDLLDSDPTGRLHGSGPAVDYFALQAKLQFEFDIASKMGEAAARRASSLRAVLWELRAPFNGEPWRQLRAYAAIYTWPQNGPAERLLAYSAAKVATDEERAKELKSVRHSIGQHVEARRNNVLYLRRWSLAAVIASFVSLFLSFWWFFRELPFDALPIQFRVVQQIVNAPSYLYGYLDRLAVRPVGSGSTRNDLTIRLGAFSYSLLHAKLYQAVYARMRPVKAAGVPGSAGAALFSGIWMRTLPFLGTVLVLWVTLRNVDDWIWAIVIGQTLTFAGNLAVYTYVRGALRAGAARLNTVPPLFEQVAGYDSVRSWVRGSLFEAAVCWGVGILLSIGALHDVWLYASMIAALNIFLLYIVKCGLDAPLIRVSMHRASFSAARLTARTPGSEGV